MIPAEGARGRCPSVAGVDPVPQDRVHLDSASGQPLHPAAREALLTAYDEGWADPARLYSSARRARQLVDGAREAVAEVLGARADEVSFPASGTLAAYDAVRGSLAGRARTGRHVVHSAVEHSVVLQCVGAGATSVPVDEMGRVDQASFAAALRSDTALACLIAASHEVGTMQPVAEVAALCAERGVPLLVDAASALPWTEVPPGWSLLTASARKWGGPGGVGVLAVRTGVRWRSAYPQDEDGRPADRAALPAVLAAAVGLVAVAAERAELDARLRPLVDRIRTAVPALGDVEVVGDPVGRLPHLVGFSCLYVDGESLVRALDERGLEVTSGSSCTSSTLEPSHVLVAMGALTHGNLRVSLSRRTTGADVDRLLAALREVVPRLRAEAGAARL